MESGRKVSGISRTHRLVFAIIAMLALTMSLLGSKLVEATQPHTLPDAEMTVGVVSHQADPASVNPSGDADPAGMVAFLDSFFREKMTTYHIPGAAVVLVQGSNSQFEIRAAMLGGTSSSSRDLIINNQSASQSGKAW